MIFSTNADYAEAFWGSRERPLHALFASMVDERPKKHFRSSVGRSAAKRVSVAFQSDPMRLAISNSRSFLIAAINSTDFALHDLPPVCRTSDTWSLDADMTHCPEGAYTLGHVWMAGLGGMGVAIVVIAVLRDMGILRDPPSEG